MVQPSYAVKERNNKVGMYICRVWNYLVTHACLYLMTVCTCLAMHVRVHACYIR